MRWEAEDHITKTLHRFCSFIKDPICLTLGVVKILPVFDHVSAGGKKIVLDSLPVTWPSYRESGLGFCDTIESERDQIQVWDKRNTRYALDTCR